MTACELIELLQQVDQDQDQDQDVYLDADGGEYFYGIERVEVRVIGIPVGF